MAYSTVRNFIQKISIACEEYITAQSMHTVHVVTIQHLTPTWHDHIRKAIRRCLMKFLNSKFVKLPLIGKLLPVIVSFCSATMTPQCYSHTVESCYIATIIHTIVSF